jgi:DNA polymerase-3 subunit epsilon
MYLAFDTETTGLTRPYLHPAHCSQPHLLQFAGILLDDLGNEICRMFTLVKPGPDAELAPEAFKAHGISLERAYRDGMSSLEVFRWFTGKARSAKLIIGHNVQFDLQVMAIVSARSTDEIWAPSCPTFCTMAHSTPILNLPPTARMMASGRYHPKAPTLSECVEHFFGEELNDAHDAAADVAASIRIFRHLSIGMGQPELKVRAQ